MIVLHALVRAALACGGGDYYDLDAPLRPVEAHVYTFLHPDPFGEEVRPVGTFLHAFRPLDPARVDALVRALDAWEPLPADPAAPFAPPVAAFHGALASGDPSAARGHAGDVVEAILDLPVPLADVWSDELRLAVEYLEVAPTLQGVPAPAVAAWFASVDAPAQGLPRPLARVAPLRAGPDPVAAADPRHPRHASARWRALREKLRTDIPDGWSADDIRSAAPKGFGHLQAAVDDWLRDFPDHPLADYARLQKVRLHYLSGEAEPAWALLLALYDRHPVRVANEMRFLTQQGYAVALDPASTPLEVVVGLLDTRPLTEPEWGAAWSRSAGLPNEVAVQEALLLYLVQHPDWALPQGFPALADAPTEDWHELRVAALVQRERHADVAALLARRAPDDPLEATFFARDAVVRADWIGAARTPGLDPAAMRWIVRVETPRSELRALFDDPDPAIAWEARLSAATRDLFATGQWKAGAALLKPVDADRAALWRQASALDKARDFEAPVAFARWLRSQGGSLFVNNDYEDIVWYRSLPEGPEVADWLRRSFATYWALREQARWLGGLDLDALTEEQLSLARQVLDEADANYNLLLNYGSWDSYAWGDVLPASEEAATIRRVGRALRERMP